MNRGCGGGGEVVYWDGLLECCSGGKVGRLRVGCIHGWINCCVNFVGIYNEIGFYLFSAFVTVLRRLVVRPWLYRGSAC